MKRSAEQDISNYQTDPDQLLVIASALASVQRLAILQALVRRRTHVSQLARDIKLSRPLVHMHLKLLEKAGLVKGSFELSAEGKALKIFEVPDFNFQVTPVLLKQLPPRINKNRREKS